MSTATLLVSCADRPGIVAGLSDFVFRHGGNIIQNDQHTDGHTGRFFMRLQFAVDRFELDREGIALAVQVLARHFHLDWSLHYDDARARVAVFCSREPHCLYDLLLRQKMGELPGDLALVVSNHPDNRAVAEHFNLPYVEIPVTAATKVAAEAQQRALLAEHRIDALVLARYMQVLSAEFVNAWPGRIINIHHSFLPAFAGAKPYHQAKARGVKLIGATAHYVTEHLDEGPIIAQDVIAVSHRDDISDLVRKGRDIERRVLATALRLHLEHRVIVEGRRTVVFA